MVNFKLHSLQNFSEEEVDAWIDDGMKKVAEKMNIDVQTLQEMIRLQSEEIESRAKFPTIDINTDERKELRSQIVEDYFEEFADAKKDKTAIVVLGQIASGKSSFCKSLLENDHAFVVDVDYIKQGYGTMPGLMFEFDNGKGTTQIHEEASMLSKQIISLASDHGYNLVIPKTGVNYYSIEKILTDLKSKGYFVGLAYVDLPIKKCIERNFYRYVNEYLSGKPSRLIPFQDIKEINDNPFLTFVRFLKNKQSGLVDSFVAMSNDVAPGMPMESIPLESIMQFESAEKQSATTTEQLKKIG